MTTLIETYRGFVYPWTIDHMYNSETDQEVATTELVGAYLDADSRKTTELPHSVIEAGESLLRADAGDKSTVGRD